MSFGGGPRGQVPWSTSLKPAQIGRIGAQYMAISLMYFKM